MQQLLTFVQRHQIESAVIGNHYDFETVLTVFELDFSEKASLLSFFNSYESKSYFVKVNNYFSGIPPPKLNKPILAKIQSFLI